MQVCSPLVLGIETSCDDTACAVVDGEGGVLASAVSSQLAAHRPYGGVVPEIASREHLRNWLPVAEEALARAGVAMAQVDAVAATRGPGLVGCLLVGLSLGRAIAWSLARPFLAVHHLEGHLYSPFLRESGEPAEAPPGRFLGLVVSGGHTTLFEAADGGVATLAETRDDAMGEVFDKVGKRLGLPYPQGPQVDALAERGKEGSFRFAVPRMGDGSLDFSYSGLKSEALRGIERLEAAGVATDLAAVDEPPAEVLDLLAGFRRAAVAQLLDRLERVRRERDVPLLAASGGVAANRLLRRELEGWSQAGSVPLRLVPLRYAGDNAAMIAHAGLLRLRRGDTDDPLAATAASRIPLGAG
ncbi:MAG: tRNA (adenosine(37)-N6)-threonylcarbamoyltransferase complex transferase subunit TsaD [Thermoanaerobaculia bacterium]